MVNDALLLFGVIIVTFFVLRLGWRRREGRPSRDRTPDRRVPGPTADHFESQSHQAPGHQAPGHPPHGLEQLTVELQSVGREIEARLDTRIRFARRLLEETEVAAARLETLLAETRTARLGEDPESPSEDDRTASAGAETLPPKSVPDSASAPVFDSKPRPPNEEHEAIAGLATQGLEPGEIAHRVGRPVGEVELILNLHRGAGP